MSPIFPQVWAPIWCKTTVKHNVSPNSVDQLWLDTSAQLNDIGMQTVLTSTKKIWSKTWRKNLGDNWECWSGKILKKTKRDKSILFSDPFQSEFKCSLWIYATVNKITKTHNFQISANILLLGTIFWTLFAKWKQISILHIKCYWLISKVQPFLSFSRLFEYSHIKTCLQ